MFIDKALTLICDISWQVTSAKEVLPLPLSYLMQCKLHIRKRPLYLRRWIVLKVHIFQTLPFHLNWLPHTLCRIHAISSTCLQANNIIGGNILSDFQEDISSSSATSLMSRQFSNKKRWQLYHQFSTETSPVLRPLN